MQILERCNFFLPKSLSSAVLGCFVTLVQHVCRVSGIFNSFIKVESGIEIKLASVWCNDWGDGFTDTNLYSDSCYRKFYPFYT